jgi:hypothetical protein
MSIYTLSVNYISEKLVPPSLRGAKHLAWLKTILKPVQTLWKYIFIDYKNGSPYANYDVSLSYNTTDRVIYSNKKVYECIKNASVGINCDDSEYWLKINDNFIGASERVKYNSQKIVFEYALNKWFDVQSYDPQIYIQNNVIAGSAFVMGSTGSYSSPMALSGVYSTTYMGLAYSFIPLYDYTIYVPTLVFNAQGSTLANRENAIRNFADIYNLIGMKYNVITY